MASTNNENRKTTEIESDIPDIPSKIPGKLVSAKRANTGKLNLHLVSSTPMNPAKKAKFFDESNQFGSPIKSGGSTTDVNSNSPDNKIKKRAENTKKNMLNEEQAEGASPFPYFTKLAVKKMTICGSDDDSDDNIFAKSDVKLVKTNKLIIDTDEKLNSDSSNSEESDEFIPKQTKAVVEPIRKVSTEDEISNKVNNRATKDKLTKKVAADEKKSDEVENKLTKNKLANKESVDKEINEVENKLAKKDSTDKETKAEATVKITKIEKVKPSDKNVLKTTRSTKSNEDNKENVNIENNGVKTKPKSQVIEKNTKNIATDTKKEKPNLDTSKQKKSNDNTVQKKTMTKNKNENNDINSKKEIQKTSNNKVASTNDTKINIAEKSMATGVRKSSRNCQSSVPYWMAPFNTNSNITTTENETYDVKRTRSNITGISIMSTKENRRPRTVPATVTKKKESTRVEGILESTVVLHRTIVKPEPEQENKNKKKEPIEENVKNITLNRSRSKVKSETEKPNIMKEPIKENVKDIALNKSKTKEKSGPEKRNNTTKKPVEENMKDITLNRSRSKVKFEPEKENITEQVEENVKDTSMKRSKSKQRTKENEKEFTIIDEVPETAKKLNKSKTKETEKKGKGSQKKPSVNENENDAEPNETASSVQYNKRGHYSKEVLDKENKEKKNKVENIAAKLKAVSPSKSNLNSRGSVHQSILGNEVYGPEIEEMDDISRTLVNKDEDVDTPFEVFSPSRSSKRIHEKNQREANKIMYTPGVVLRRNIKSTLKKKPASTATSKQENKSVKSKKMSSKKLSTQKSNIYLDEFNGNGLESEDLFNPESSNDNDIPQPTRRKRRVNEIPQPVKRKNKTTITTPGLNGKHAHKNTRQFSKSSKQVNFDINDFEMDNSFDSESLCSDDNPSRISCQASYRYKINPHRQFGRSRDSKYLRKKLFLRPDSIDGGSRRSCRNGRYVTNDSVEDNSDSWNSEEMYMPRTKKRKYMARNTSNKHTLSHNGFLNFKENALNVQMPVLSRTLTKIQHRGKSMFMECFGTFPKIMTRINEQSSLRGTCFMNDWFAAGVMEIIIGTVKKCNASNNHTYFVVLDGIAEIGIAGSAKILRIGDCCIVPKHTVYYIANASNEMNLLLNFLKVSL